MKLTPRWVWSAVIGHLLMLLIPEIFAVLLRAFKLKVKMCRICNVKEFPPPLCYCTTQTNMDRLMFVSSAFSWPRLIKNMAIIKGQFRDQRWKCQKELQCQPLPCSLHINEDNSHISFSGSNTHIPDRIVPKAQSRHCQTQDHVQFNLLYRILPCNIL